MPRPTSSTTIGRQDLGAIAYEYMMAADQQGFIASQVLPIFDVPLQTGQYPKIPIEAILKKSPTKRAPRSGYNRGDYEFEIGTYACKEYGWEEPLDDSELEMYRHLFDAEQVATLRAALILLRDYEARVAAKVFNTGNITLTSAVSVEWSTVATCTPKADVKTAIEAMRLASGLRANAVVMNETVFNNVLVSTELKTYLQYTSPHLIETRMAQRDMLAKYFSVDQVIVAGGMYDSADKGQAASLAEIWDDEYVLVAKLAAATGRDLRDPCLGRTFLWTGDSPQIITTEQYRDETKRSAIYRVRHNVDEAFVFAGAGYLLSNITV